MVRATVSNARGSGVYGKLFCKVPNLDNKKTGLVALLCNYTTVSNGQSLLSFIISTSFSSFHYVEFQILFREATQFFLSGLEFSFFFFFKCCFSNPAAGLTKTITNPSFLDQIPFLLHFFRVQVFFSFFFFGRKPK